IVKVEDPKRCPRYIGRIVKNIKVGESPEWLKKRLASLGQKSINNVVDAANYAMLLMGQPVHVFDLNTLAYSGKVPTVTVRLAREGETMTTLDGKDLVFDPSMLVMTDDTDVLDIAGIKGGNKAGITSETKNLVLETANFDGGPIRKTSTKLGIKTDASFRFEHELSPVLAERGM
ncbi:MAG: B3/4 domain-containing protein, partial [Candidatus Paceibacterota bacterium]